jgi:hypothetical protein
MAYDFRYNANLRPALGRAAGFFVGVAPTLRGDSGWNEFLSGTAGVPPAFFDHHTTRRQKRACLTKGRQDGGGPRKKHGPPATQ